MKKLYTEKQYREYAKLMDMMANNDDMLLGMDIHVKITDWLIDNHISAEAEAQMDERMEKEDLDTDKGKVIPFPVKK